MKGFFKNLKTYVDGVFKADFGELLIYFFEIAIIALVPLVLLFPVAFVKDIIANLFIATSSNSNTLNNIINLIFSIIYFIVYVFGFVYLFNRRYEDFKKAVKDKKKKEKETSSKVVIEEEEIELPKTK